LEVQWTAAKKIRKGDIGRRRRTNSYSDQNSSAYGKHYESQPGNSNPHEK
jgi:hypothetical protein